MPQIFHPSAVTLSRITIFEGGYCLKRLLFLSYLLMQSPYQTCGSAWYNRSQCHFRTSITCAVWGSTAATVARPSRRPRSPSLAADNTCMKRHSADLGEQPDARAGSDQPC